MYPKENSKVGYSPETTIPTPQPSVRDHIVYTYGQIAEARIRIVGMLCELGRAQDNLELLPMEKEPLFVVADHMQNMATDLAREVDILRSLLL